jgi:hypothetical protein
VAGLDRGDDVALHESHSFKEKIVLKVAGERRSKQRYALELTVEYRVLGRYSSITGSGTLINISSGGVAFTNTAQLKLHTNLELSISWPILLNGKCPLRLIMIGHVVRSSRGFTAIQARRHEFRTQGKLRAATSGET